MKVRVLGCSGAIAQGCRTTSFLLDGRILIDAGTGVGDLTLAEMRQIDHVLLTHAHLDHVAALPLMLDAVSSLRSTPVQVHALPATIAALQAHIFNNVIWPDFSCIPSAEAPLLAYTALETGQVLQLAGLNIEVLPAIHTVPAVGYAVQGRTGWWAFSGDTGPNPAFWQRINQLPLAMLVLETAFGNHESALAQRSLHLSPHTLAQELAQLAPGRHCPIYITHTKPSETQLILEEVRRFDAITPHGQATPHDIRWLQAGDAFDL
ncbi:3',5'-cyclic-nucleotide phosphodiesterase [Acidovorax carolinensis]|uniref:3',5'-cyclic-nucleotide phosphodiesterase n=1 Tax=Acidovorax carolinensis TaxID=553814 RepID=A0A240UHN4_9BURK|nr:3',5'-cyclic-nucleotide phosphodiesterase [Acidovorax carolinensis]ART53831.1 3',5'-cyclic-nucleotide phosphodiesterase [Acidovorax carolinensis]ART60583.1 3',5'-cyclic-nucleotide phosphodiesterase [Acidovorax carolinensis]